MSAVAEKRNLRGYNFDDGEFPTSITMHPARQARLQYHAMLYCEHEIGEADQVCPACLGSFAAIHAQHTFLERLATVNTPGMSHVGYMIVDTTKGYGSK